MTTPTTKTSLRSAFQLKGSQFTLPVLLLHHCDLEAIARQMDHTIGNNPTFFKNAPVVIDLKNISDEDTRLTLTEITQLLRKYGLIPVAVRNASVEQAKAAVAAALGVLLENTKTPTAAAAKPDNTETSPSSTLSKIITNPVRSGMQIYAKNTDLFVLGSVSHGAEIIADGHIYVEGPLRGRALAGKSGNTDAKIFCHQLEAELVSIAGFYVLKDDLDLSNVGDRIQIYLENEEVKISSF